MSKRSVWRQLMREVCGRNTAQRRFVRSMQRARIKLCQSRIRRLAPDVPETDFGNMAGGLTIPRSAGG